MRWSYHHFPARCRSISSLSLDRASWSQVWSLFFLLILPLSTCVGRPLPVAINTGHQRTSGLEIERRQGQQQHVFSASPSSSLEQHLSAAYYDFGTSGQGSQAASPDPSSRWGQASVLLPDSKAILFMGGQKEDESFTSDTLLLDVSALQSRNSTTHGSWKALSSEGVPSHAFAAASVVKEGARPTVWLLGGITPDCQSPAPAHVWVSRGSNGSWLPMAADEVPVRRQGARAIRMPSPEADRQHTNGNISSSLLILGGRNASVASPLSTSRDIDSAAYSTFEVWSDRQNRSAHATEARKSDVRTLALPPSMSDVSLVHYSTVQLPRDRKAAQTSSAASDRVLFLGGRTADGHLASLSHFWALCLQSNRWEKWTATGSIPAGRVGHSTVRMPNGKILLYGGMVDSEVDINSSTPVAEAYILDPSTTPAIWRQVRFPTSSGSAPARAFHSAHLVGDVMVVGFGKDAVADSSPVKYLDMSDSGSLKWYETIPALFAGRATAAGQLATPFVTHKVLTAAVPSATQPPQREPTAHGAAVMTSSAPRTSVISGSHSQASQTPHLAASPAPVATDKTGALSKDQQTKTVDGGSTSTSASAATSAASADGDHAPASKAKKGAVIGSAVGAAAMIAVLGALYAHRRRPDDAEECDPGKEVPPVSSLRLSQAAPEDKSSPDELMSVLPACLYSDSHHLLAVPPPPKLRRPGSSDTLRTDKSFGSACASHLSYPFLSAMHRPSRGGRSLSRATSFGTCALVDGDDETDVEGAKSSDAKAGGFLGSGRDPILGDRGGGRTPFSRRPRGTLAIPSPPVAAKMAPTYPTSRERMAMISAKIAEQTASAAAPQLSTGVQGEGRWLLGGVVDRAQASGRAQRTSLHVANDA